MNNYVDLDRKIQKQTLYLHIPTPGYAWLSLTEDLYKKGSLDIEGSCGWFCVFAYFILLFHH